MLKKWIKSLKISQKIMYMFLFACVFPLTIVSIIIYEMSADNLEEATMEFATIFSFQIVSDMNELIDDYERITKSILINDEFISSLDIESDTSISKYIERQILVNRAMTQLMILKPEIKETMLLTEDGALFYDSHDIGHVNQKILEEQEWLKEVRASRKTIQITAAHEKPYRSVNPKERSVTIARKIYNYSGALIAILLIELNPADLVTLSEGDMNAQNTYHFRVNIVDKNERIVYDSDLFTGKKNWDEVLEGLDEDRKNSEEYLLIRDVTEEGDLSVNILIHRDDLLSQLNKIEWVAWVIIVFSVIGVVVITFCISRGITKPIRHLQDSIKRVEKGVYEGIDDPGRTDEVGALVKSYNHMIRKIRELIENVYIAEIKERDTRYLALQVQINPHMLYNTLETIRMKALLSGADEVADMLKMLAKMYRMTLGKKSTNHSVRDEIEHAECFLKVHNMRSQGTYTLDVNVDERIKDALMIPLVLQPIIENSIEHGTNGVKKSLQIQLTARFTEEEDILLMIHDNGKGITEERVKEVNDAIHNGQPVVSNVYKQERSIGLSNIAERIKLNYGQKYYLKIGKTDTGAQIEMCIPARWQTPDNA